MDFNVEDWTVGQAADYLNSSLFCGHVGTTKKLKKQKKKKAIEGKIRDHPTSISTAQHSLVKSPKPQHRMGDSVGENQEKRKKGMQKNKTKTSKETVEGKMTVSQSKVLSGGDEGKEKREKSRKKKLVISTENMDGETNVSQKKDAASGVNCNRKRKQSGGEVGSVGKKQNLGQNAAVDTANETSDGETKKRRRKRKKKNSSKKNKYAHLSAKKQDPGETVEGKTSCDVDTTGENLNESKSGTSSEITGVKKNKNKSVKSPGVQERSQISNGLKKSKKDKEKNKGVAKKVQNSISSGNVKAVHKQQDTTGVNHDVKTGKNQANQRQKLDVNVIGKMLSASPGLFTAEPRKDNKTSTLESESVSTPQKHKETSAKKAGKQTVLSLKDRMLDKLKSARFRFLNEQLYKQTGRTSFTMFEEDHEAFDVYHQGFQSQVSKWPSNPVDIIIKEIQARPRNLVVADFGCGDAKIARSVPNKVHSFDLMSINEHVTPCDMAKVPLKPGTVDIAVFCLSLMGTNLPDYIKEASRVLKPGGLLKVAEVTSRIRNPPNFITTMERFGFRLKHEDTSNRMFCLFDFTKTKPSKSIPSEFHLEACVYKRR